MKPKCILLLVMLAWIGLNTFAQDYRKMSTDSLKAEILKKINDKTWSLEKITEIKDDGSRLTISTLVINSWEAISITEDSLVFKMKKRIIAISLRNKIYYSLNDMDGKWTKESIRFGDNYKLDRDVPLEDYKLRPLLSSLLSRKETEKYDKELAEFRETCKTYRELSEKPAITEEQRKYIVQANATNEKKDYANASQLFRKVIEINPTSYPAAYFNLALISAERDAYLYAIFNMKKYLILFPDAPDARAARDKIHEWEFEIERN